MAAKVFLKRVFLILLALFGYALGLPCWRRLRGRRRGPFRVLRYHSISDARDHETVVTPSAFRKHMQWLKRHCDVVDGQAVLQTGGDGDRPRVLVTFDDGYADNVSVALPIVKEQGIRPLMFLLSGYVGTDNLLPHDQGRACETHRLMRWEEARQCDPADVEFGSHGRSHQRMSRLDAEALRREIEGSRQLLEREIGRPVRFFSYPFGVDGDYDERAAAAVRAAGYQAAFNAKYGENHEGTARWDLYRIGIERSDNVFTLRAKINGALDVMRVAETRAGRRIVRLLNRWVGA